MKKLVFVPELPPKDTPMTGPKDNTLVPVEQVEADLAAIGPRPAGKVLQWSDPRPCFYVNVGGIDGCVCLGCRERKAREEYVASSPNPTPISDQAERAQIVEALDQACALIQEAKGIAGPGSVTDHLDFAESWLDRIPAALAATQPAPPAPVEGRGTRA